MTALIDIIFLVLIAFFIIVGFRKGFMRTLLSFLARIASFVAAFFVSRNFAPEIYNSFLKEKVTSVIDTRISDEISSADITTGISSVFSEMSDGLRKLCDLIGLTEGMITENVKNSDFTSNVAVTLEETIAAPILTIICQLIIFAVVSTVASFLLNIVVRMICKVVKLPVLRTADGLLGGGLGFINGVLITYVLSCVLIVVASFADNAEVAEIINSSKIIELFTNNSLFI